MLQNGQRCITRRSCLVKKHRSRGEARQRIDLQRPETYFPARFQNLHETIYPRIAMHADRAGNGFYLSLDLTQGGLIPLRILRKKPGRRDILTRSGQKLLLQS